MKRIAIALTLGLTLAACSTTDSGNDKVQVMSSMYPAQFLAERIGGDLVDVSSVTPPGADPHEAELTPRLTQDLLDADVVLWFEGMQPAVDATLEQADRNTHVTINLAQGFVEHEEDDKEGNHDHHDHAEHDHEGHGHDHGSIDPHVWLNPEMMIHGTQEVRDALITAAPEHEAAFTENAEKLEVELTSLHEDFQSGLAQCEHRTIVTGHAAFGHLASTYDLEQVSILGLVSHDEPSAADLARISDLMKDEGISTIFTETSEGDAMTETIARETGADIAVLYPVELAPKSPQDYISVMRSNLDSLQGALNCR